MTREEILGLANQAGWDCRFTRLTSEREFNSVPLEIEQIEKFVALVKERLNASPEGFSGSR